MQIARTSAPWKNKTKKNCTRSILCCHGHECIFFLWSSWSRATVTQDESKREQSKIISFGDPHVVSSICLPWLVKLTFKFYLDLFGIFGMSQLARKWSEEHLHAFVAPSSQWSTIEIELWEYIEFKMPGHQHFGISRVYICGFHSPWI